MITNHSVKLDTIYYVLTYYAVDNKTIVPRFLLLKYYYRFCHIIIFRKFISIPLLSTYLFFSYIRPVFLATLSSTSINYIKVMGHQRFVPFGVLLWAIFATSSALVHPRPSIGAPSVKYFVQPLPSSSSREKSLNDIQLYSRRTVCLTTKEDPGEEANVSYIL